MKSIYDTDLNNVSPQPTWLYTVDFFFTNGEINGFSDFKKYAENSVRLTPISISLPQKETTTKDIYYCGTKMSVPVFTNMSGDLSCDFLLTPESLKLFLGNLKGDRPGRPEFSTRFGKLRINLLDMHGEEKYEYLIYNPIITTIEHSDSLAYDSEDMIKLSITIHYNSWKCRPIYKKKNDKQQ